MLRHKESQHGQMMNEEDISENETEMSDQDDNSEEGEDQNDSANTESSDDDTEDEEESDSSDSDEKEVNIWDILKGKAISQLNDEADIDKEDVLDVISGYYTTLLKFHHYARKDKYHKKIMTTKKRLMNEEEYGPVEAIDAAVKQRRFAISEAAGIGNDITDMSLLANEDSDS